MRVEIAGFGVGYLIPGLLEQNGQVISSARPKTSSPRCVAVFGCDKNRGKCRDSNFAVGFDKTENMNMLFKRGPILLVNWEMINPGLKLDGTSLTEKCLKWLWVKETKPQYPVLMDPHPRRKMMASS